MPYVLKKHTCWHPIGLLVEDGSVWQCGRCKRYWMRSRLRSAGWSQVSPEQVSNLLKEEEEGND